MTEDEADRAIEALNNLGAIINMVNKEMVGHISPEVAMMEIRAIVLSSKLGNE
jgi:hypothetical protein